MDRSRFGASAVCLVLILGACGPTRTPATAPASASSPTPAPTPLVRATQAPNRTGLDTAAPSLNPTEASSSLPATPGAREFNVDLSVELMAHGFPGLTLLSHAGDGSGALYAVGQNGVISVLTESGVQPVPFMDIDERVRSRNEQGLLGLAFHPDYESNGRLFVNYINNDGATVVSEFLRSDDQPGLLVADPGSERVLLQIEQPYANHNGGMLAFGADGYLYIGMGDGGSGGDPLGNGQALGTLLGKMLRIDVDSGDPYAIPADNPFIGVGVPEIWSYGWRNPWRFSFDRETGALFVGDVGQGAREEVDAEPAGIGGRNYGWNVMEGDVCFRTDPCDATGLTPPVAINDRSNGECAVIGGYVYRGTAYPDLVGAYVFSDNCTGTLWTLDAEAALVGGRAEAFALGDANFSPTSFGEDENGELYVVNGSGEVYRLVATSR